MVPVLCQDSGVQQARRQAMPRLYSGRQGIGRGRDLRGTCHRGALRFLNEHAPFSAQSGETAFRRFRRGLQRAGRFWGRRRPNHLRESRD